MTEIGIHNHDDGGCRSLRGDEDIAREASASARNKPHRRARLSIADALDGAVNGAAVSDKHVKRQIG
jgi:hypothetical protein